MAELQIRFDDGASYETMMGVWSRLAGQVFLEWLSPAPGLRWVDVGCGNGAFTELLAERCAPVEVRGIDPSAAQLVFARQRRSAKVASFVQGDAMALPFSDDEFDAAAMALVIFFVPDPAKGVAEMARVVKDGGTMAAYAWDMDGGGFPYDPVLLEMQAAGLRPGRPPQSAAAGIESLRTLWTGAGAIDVETREITVARDYASFEDYWTIALTVPSYGAALNGLTPDELNRLKASVRTRMGATGSGHLTCSARANAVKGIVRK